MNSRNYVPGCPKRERRIDIACAIGVVLLSVACAVLLAWRG